MTVTGGDVRSAGSNKAANASTVLALVEDRIVVNRTGLGGTRMLGWFERERR